MVQLIVSADLVDVVVNVTHLNFVPFVGHSSETTSKRCVR